MRTQKRRTNVSCAVLVMILVIYVPSQTVEDWSKVLFSVMAAMDVFQRITVQGTVSRKIM